MRCWDDWISAATTLPVKVIILWIRRREWSVQVGRNLSRYHTPPHSTRVNAFASTMPKAKHRYRNSAPIPVWAPEPPKPQPERFSPPLAMQQAIWDSISNGNFIDAKIFAYSRRSSEPGRVDTPKALFVNTHVLATACSYFRSSTRSPLPFSSREPSC
jgi:hypothetical protein